MKKSLLALFFLGMFFVGQSQNTPPVALAGTASGLEDDAAITGSVSATDADNGDALTYSVVDGVTAAQGTLSFDPDGTYSFTPAADFNGDVKFTFKANDGTDDSDPATVTITVVSVNDAPVANDGSANGPEDGGPITGSVSATDTEGDALTYSVVDGVTDAQGTLSLHPTTGAFSFTPAANYNGTVTFTYRASDGTANSGTATVTIKVNPVNDPPTLSDVTKPNVNEDVVVTFTAADFSSKFNDVDGDALTKVQITSLPSNGTLKLGANNVTLNQEINLSDLGTLTFVPEANYNGTVTFTFTANDGTVDSGPATVTITVNPVNDAPSFTKGANQTKPEDPGPQTVTGWATNISAGPSNESGQILSFVVTNNNPGLFTTAGQPKIDATTGTLTYTPALDAFGQAIVTVILKDDGGTPGDISDDLSVTQTFTITITSVRDAADRKILINEVYTNPGGNNKSEFFELYNTSIDQTPVQLDCFTMAVYYKNANNDRGFYVIDLPQSTIAAKQFYVGASKTPFNAQNSNGVSANFDWSNPGSTGFIKKYKFNNLTGSSAGYSEVAISNINDIFQTENGGNLAAFLFNKGVYVHGITVGFDKGTTVSNEITELPPLEIPLVGGAGSNCGAGFIADWKNAVNVAEFNPGAASGGTDNGFARSFDGNCGSWEKTAANTNGGGISHTPGKSNTPAKAVQYSILTTSQNIICGTRLDYSVRSSDPNVFPVDMRVYEDVNKNGIFDLGDVLVGSPVTISSSMAAVQSFSGLDPNKTYLVVYNTNLGCSDAILPPSTNLGITTAQYSYCNQQFGAAITATNEVALANAFPVTVNFYNTVNGVKTLIGTGSILAPSTIQVYSNFSATPYTPANISIEYVPKSSSCLATITVANVAPTSFVNVTGSLQTNERFVLLTPNTAGSPGKMEVRVTGITTSGPGFIAANVVPVTANLFYDKDPAKTTDDVFIESMIINDFSTQFQQFQKVFTKADLDANGQFLVVTYTANMQCLTNRSPQQSMQVLPVKFSYFTAQRASTNKNQVQLEWETSMEQNNKGFYLQRMTRGEWQDIGFVNTAAPGGNSNLPLKYRYNDVNLFAGTTYYRMYQVDFDGKADYSEVKSVDGPGSSNKSVVIYPNPAYGGSTTVVFASETPKQILLSDGKGRIIQQWRNYTGTRLGISQLKPGFYTLSIQDGAHGSPVIEKIIVQ